MRKYLLALTCILAPVAAHAFSPVRQVQISTNSLTQQTGAFNVASGTVQGLTANKLTVVSSATINGPLGVTGSFTQPMTVTSSITVPTLGVTSSINQPLTITSSLTVTNNAGILGTINQPLTAASSVTVNNNFAVMGTINQPLTVASSETITGNWGVQGQITQPVTATSSVTINNNFGVTGAINKPLTVTSSATVSNTLGATTFTDTLGRSIYGNFVASATATSASSITVNVSGYNGYVVRVFLTNASGAKASGLLRVNKDTTTNYSYSNQGWLLTVSSGVSCGNTAANHLLLTGLNSLGNGVNMTATVNVDINSVSYYNATTMYQESTGNNVANINMAGGANLTGITSFSVWVGLINSCTAVTIPATGTTGSIWVWGVY